jgi:hypothetical protein
LRNSIDLKDDKKEDSLESDYKTAIDEISNETVRNKVIDFIKNKDIK